MINMPKAIRSLKSNFFICITSIRFKWRSTTRKTVTLSGVNYIMMHKRIQDNIYSFNGLLFFFKCGRAFAIFAE